MPLERSQVEQIVKKFGNSLKKHGIRPERIILFGSYAKNIASDYSDIDLIVVSNDFSGLSLVSRCTIMGKAIAEIMEPIEPHAYTPGELEELLPTSVIGSLVRDPQEYTEISIQL